MIQRPELKPLLKATLVQVVILFVISFTYIYIVTVHNLLTLILTVLAVTLPYQLFNYMTKEERKYTNKEFFKSVLLIIIGVSAFWVLFAVVGNWGWIGIPVLVLVLAAYRVYKGRELFKQTSRWIGQTIKGDKK